MTHRMLCSSLLVAALTSPVAAQSTQPMLFLAILLGQWGAYRAACLADLNKDSVVDGLDLAILLSQWG